MTLAISKKPGENAVDVAEKVIERVNSLQGSVLPEGVEVSVTRNYGATADDKAKKLIQKLIFATASVVLLVLFAIGSREALIVGAAVLLTLAATLFASWAWGFTLNRVSLFALIFSIGILVDDAIVVVENIHRRMGLDHDGLEAIIPRAVDEVGGPTILATFTVIAALLPMAFVSGLMGPYMSPIPINASIGMLISLAIAFIVTPWLALKLIKQDAHDTHGGETKLLTLFRTRLTPFLRGTEGRGARRMLWLGIGLAILVSVALPAVQLVILKMLPFDNKSEFQIIVDLPVGTPLEKTAQVLSEMGTAVAAGARSHRLPGLCRHRGTDQLQRPGAAVLPAHRPRGGRPAGQPGRQARPRPQEPRDRAGDPSCSRGHREKARRRRQGGRSAARPAGDVADRRRNLRSRLRRADRRSPSRCARCSRRSEGIVAIDDTVEDDAQRFVLRVLQNKAALAGVAQKDIVAAMKMGLSGENVTPIHGSGAKYEIPVRITLPPERQSEIGELLKLTVRGSDGNLVPLSELVEVMPSEREKTIYHKNLLPVVFVIGDTGGTLDSPLYGLFGMRGDLKDMALEQGGTLSEYFHPPARRPLCRIQPEVGRRMAGDLRNLPRHGPRLCLRTDADLHPGGGAIQELSHAAHHHGADPAHRHRRDAGPRPARRRSSPPPR